VPLATPSAYTDRILEGLGVDPFTGLPGHDTQRQQGAGPGQVCLDRLRMQARGAMLATALERRSNSRRDPPPKFRRYCCARILGIRSMPECGG